MPREKVDPHFRDLAYEVLEPFSRDFLVQSGVSPGMSVLELGCGAGAMTPWIAKMVGPRGRVIAIDINVRALEAARIRVQSQGLDNVEFVLRSVQDATSLGYTYDLIYGRFILMQLAKPFETVEKLISCLKPGGVVALDEPNQEADFAVPSCPPCEAANRVFMEFADRVGMNFRIGDSLFPMLRRLGLDILCARAHQPILPIHQALQMFKHGLLDSVEPLFESGAIDEGALDQLIGDLDGWYSKAGDYYALSRQVQISGKMH